MPLISSRLQYSKLEKSVAALDNLFGSYCCVFSLGKQEKHSVKKFVLDPRHLIIE